MTFAEPIPFQEALDDLAARQLLPTALSSAEIREQWESDLRQRSLFSARTTKADILASYREQLTELLDGQTNVATARAKLQDLFDGLGYDAERGGFEGEEVEPAERGSLRDLSSDQRINLVLQTNLRQVANAAFHQRATQDDELYWFPAYELVRIYPRQVPRGERRVKGGIVPDPGQDWPSRWEKIGGEFYDGRMIALKTSELWHELGSSANFNDGLDASFPPFAFNSGFGWREVPRRECVALGVAGASDPQAPHAVRVNEGLQQSAQDFSTEELKAIRAGLQTEIAAGKIKLSAEKARAGK